MNRRHFVRTLGAAAAVGLAGSPVRSLAAVAGGGRIDRVGLGLFSIPGLLDRDFTGALKRIADIGYREVEFFGPYPFSAPEAAERWRTVAGMLGLRDSGYYGHTPAAVRALLDEHGLAAPSMHTDLATLRTRMDALAEAAHVVGHRYVVLPAIPEEERKSLDDYRRIADVFNEIGARADRHGLRFAYHNHGYGLAPLEGAIPFDVVLERTDPALVDLQMDLFWTAAGGADAVAYLDAHPGRFRLLHIKDMTEHRRFPGDGSTAEEWIALFPYMTDAGAGVFDLQRVLSHAKKGGAEHFFVERDLAAHPDEALRKSYTYLAGLVLDA